MGYENENKKITKNGFETMLQTNYISHFYLSHLLLPILINSATKTESVRVITIGSERYKKGAKNMQQYVKNCFENQKFETFNNDFKNYGLSKQCNILFAREFNRRYQKNGILSVCVNPTPANTHLSRNLFANQIILSIFSFFLKKPSVGANTTVMFFFFLFFFMNVCVCI